MLTFISNKKSIKREKNKHQPIYELDRAITRGSVEYKHVVRAFQASVH